MKIYYLDHPEHGTHVCYSESDVKIAEKNGWILRKDEPVIEKTVAEDEPVIEKTVAEDEPVIEKTVAEDEPVIVEKEEKPHPAHAKGKR